MGFGPVMLFARPELAPGVDRTLWRETAGASPGSPCWRALRAVDRREPRGGRAGRSAGRAACRGTVTGWSSTSSATARSSRTTCCTSTSPRPTGAAAPPSSSGSAGGSAGSRISPRVRWSPRGRSSIRRRAPCRARGPGGAGGRRGAPSPSGSTSRRSDGPSRTGRLEVMDPGRGDHAERDDLVSGTDESDDGYEASCRARGACCSGPWIPTRRAEVCGPLALRWSDAETATRASFP